MTQKEINEFLANTKLYVNGKSKEIQEKLFSLGYCWTEGKSTKVMFEDKPFLYIDDAHNIAYGCNMDNFIWYDYREISAEEILSLELTQPSYRPFKTHEECWQEMLKHKPFGWIQDNNYRNYYRNIVIVNDYEIELTPYYTVDGKNLQDMISYKDAIKKYKFADGTPFGIKEE